MKLIDIVERVTPPAPWSVGEKIPWNDPGFSQRMLENHLSQAHDWASRRLSVIERQVAWINRLLNGKKVRVLDLGCGPGFYTHQLTGAGYECTGVDFSPASIEYARQQTDEANLSIDYVLDDVRNYTPVGRFGLIMMLFGEFNVFTAQDARQLLAKAADALDERGILLIEASSYDSIRAQGALPSTWEALETGLFLEQPHLYLQEHFWDEALSVATTRYTVIQTVDGNVCEYGASVQAYTDGQYKEIFADAELQEIAGAEQDKWPVGEDFSGRLKMFACRRR